jgi:hypothetical protein
MASATNSDDDGDNVSADGSSLSSGLELKKEASRKVQQPPKLIFSAMSVSFTHVPLVLLEILGGT